MQTILRRAGSTAALVALLVVAPTAAVAPAAATAPRFAPIAGVVRLVAPAGATAPLPSARVVRDLPDGSVAIDVPAWRAADAYAALAGRYRPGAVRPDAVERILADHIPSDPFWPDMTWARRIGMPAAWGVSLGSPEVVIAIVDSGVNEAADLAGAVLPGRSFVGDVADTADRNGHGTLVAQTAAARVDNAYGAAGVCPRCAILPVRVSLTSGHGWASDVDSGIVWAVDHGATVINLSLGGRDSDGVHDAAVRYARAAGVSVVAAAGNDGSATPEYPASTPGVLGVAWTDDHDVLDPASTRGTWVDLAAPGDIKAASTRSNEWFTASGTSFSSPMVAGALGLLASAVPGSTMAQREAALLSTARAVTPAGSIGGGRIDVAAALAALAAEVPPTPTPAPPVAGAPVLAMTAPSRAVTYVRAATVDVAWTETFVPGEAAGARTVVQESAPVAGGVCDGDAWSASPEPEASPEAATFRTGPLADRTCYRWRIGVVDRSGRAAERVSGIVFVDRRKPVVRAVLPKRLTTISAGTLAFRWSVDDGTAGSGVVRTTVVSEKGWLTARGCGRWSRADRETLPYIVTEESVQVWGPICIRLKVTVVDAAGNQTATVLAAYRHS